MICVSLMLCMSAIGVHADQTESFEEIVKSLEAEQADESWSGSCGMPNVVIESDADPLVLMAAVRDGKFQPLREYVIYGHGNDRVRSSRVHARLANGMSLLEVAVRYGGDDVVRFLIEQGSEVRKRDGKGNSLATLAAWQGRSEVLKMLLNASPDPVNLEEIWLKLVELPIDPYVFYTAGNMMKVMQHDRERTIPPALRLDDRILSPVGDGRYDPKVLRELLERGVDTATRRSSDGATALHAFIYTGRPEIIKLLLSFHADVNARDAAQRTPLMYAAGFNERDAATNIVRMLLDAGADVNAQDSNGQTALMKAVARNLSEIAEMLLMAGSDPSLEDKKGMTALDIYASQSSPCLNASCVDAMCARFDWGRHATNSTSVFRRAVDSGNIDLLRRIGDDWQSRGISPEDVYKAVMDTIGNSALGEKRGIQMIDYLLPKCPLSVIGHAWAKAEDRGKTEIAAFFREKLQDRSVRGRALSGVVRGTDSMPFMAEKLEELMNEGVDEADVVDALWSAAAVDNEAAVKYLLAQGIDPHGVDKEGRTILMMLTHEHDDKMHVVDLLISSGVDVSAKDVSGKTAAMWAEKRGMPKLAQRLRDDEKAPKAQEKALP